ncbi:MAG: hypothetical protein ABI468_00700 [Candidatus Nanopelagicales bacterium]
MYRGHLARPTRVQVLLAAAMFASYAVGYPVAIVADSAIGWLLVMLGGVFLMLLVGVTVRRITAAPRAEPAQPEVAPASNRIPGADRDVS